MELPPVLSVLREFFSGSSELVSRGNDFFCNFIPSSSERYDGCCTKERNKWRKLRMWGLKHCKRRKQEFSVSRKWQNGGSHAFNAQNTYRSEGFLCEMVEPSRKSNLKESSKPQKYPLSSWWGDFLSVFGCTSWAG